MAHPAFKGSGDKGRKRNGSKHSDDDDDLPPALDMLDFSMNATSAPESSPEYNSQNPRSKSPDKGSNGHVRETSLTGSLIEQPDETPDPRFSEMFRAIAMLMLYLVLLQLQYTITTKYTINSAIILDANLASAREVASLDDIWAWLLPLVHDMLPTSSTCEAFSAYHAEHPNTTVPYPMDSGIVGSLSTTKIVVPMYISQSRRYYETLSSSDYLHSYVKQKFSDQDADWGGVDPVGDSKVREIRWPSDAETVLAEDVVSSCGVQDKFEVEILSDHPNATLTNISLTLKGISTENGLAHSITVINPQGKSTPVMEAYVSPFGNGPDIADVKERCALLCKDEFLASCRNEDAGECVTKEVDNGYPLCRSKNAHWYTMKQIECLRAEYFKKYSSLNCPLSTIEKQCRKYLPAFSGDAISWTSDPYAVNATLIESMPKAPGQITQTITQYGLRASTYRGAVQRAYEMGYALALKLSDEAIPGRALKPGVTISSIASSRRAASIIFNVLVDPAKPRLFKESVVLAKNLTSSQLSLCIDIASSALGTDVGGPAASTLSIAPPTAIKAHTPVEPAKLQCPAGYRKLAGLTKPQSWECGCDCPGGCFTDKSCACACESINATATRRSAGDHRQGVRREAVQPVVRCPKGPAGFDCRLQQDLERQRVQEVLQRQTTTKSSRRTDLVDLEAEALEQAEGGGGSEPPPKAWPPMFYSHVDTPGKEWASLPVKQGPWIMNLSHSLDAIGGPVNGTWTLQIRCPSFELPTTEDLERHLLVKRAYTAGSIGGRCGTGGYLNGYVVQLGYTYNATPAHNFTMSATKIVTKTYYQGDFETPLRIASKVSYFPTYDAPWLQFSLRPSEVKYLIHKQPTPGTGWKPACIIRADKEALPLFMFPFVPPATAPGLQNPITQLQYCDEMQQQEPYDRVQYMYVTSHPVYLDACKAVMTAEEATSVVHRLAMLGYSTSEIFSNELKCGSAISADTQTYHALTAYRDLEDGQGSSFNILVDYRTSPVPSLMSYLFLNILKHVEWLDALTVQVEVAMITYNPNLKFLTMVVVTFDIDVAGGVSGEYEIVSFPSTLDPHDAETYFRFILEILVVIAVGASIISELRDMLGVQGICSIDTAQLGSHVQAWWGDGWNVVDVLRIILFVFAIILWTDIWLKIDSDLTPYIGDNSITSAEQYSKTRSAFEDCASTLNLYAVVNGFNLMVHLLWILKYMRHPRLAIVKNSIGRSGDEFAHFGLIFAVIFGTYTVIANLFFGENLKSYHTFAWSLETCLLMVLGDFDYGAIREEWPLGANVFFWSFIVLCSLILFNMIIGIVFVAYENESSGGDKSNMWAGMSSQLVQGIRNKANAVTGKDTADPAQTGTPEVQMQPLKDASGPKTKILIL